MKTSILLVAALLVSLLVRPAMAHHFKGLPHFSYFENYPQVPQEEYLGRIGHFETSLMIYDFQGLKKSDAVQPDDVRMYLVLFDLKNDKTYTGPLTLRVLDGESALAERKFPHSEEESLYAFTRKLPLDGDLSLEITLGDGSGLVDRLPFLLSNQRMAWGRWVSILLVSLVGFAAWGSRRMRVLQDRKENTRAHLATES